MIRDVMRLAIRFAVIPICAAPAVAQLKLVSVFGPSTLSHLGSDMKCAGDVNADGILDIVAGEPTPLITPVPGKVKVFSGVNGAMLHQFSGDAIGENYGFVVGGAGDVDADGFDDVIVGSRNWGPGDTNGAVRVYSGATGAPLHTLVGDLTSPTATCVVGLGDLDADGHDDFAVAYYQSTLGGVGAGRVTVHSGANAAVLYDIVGTPGQGVGGGVDTFGDFDGDGVRDFFINLSGDDVTIAGRMRVYSGATGNTLTEFVHPLGSGIFGAGAGDVNNDGVPDVISSEVQYVAPGGAFDAGRVVVRSGADGSVLFTLTGTTAFQGFGYYIGAGGDYDGDGFDDFLVGERTDEDPASPHLGGGKLFSGFDGHLLRLMRTYGGSDEFGLRFALLGDVDGDGRFDYAGAASYASSGKGAVYVFSLEPKISNYCTSTVNSTGSAATARASGYASFVANDLNLIADHVPANKPAMFMTSQTQAQIPFGNGFQCVGSPIKRVGAPTPASAGGVVDVDFSIQASPWSSLIAVGSTWNFQCWFRDVAGGGSGFNFSDGLQVTFIP
ncbi:MAG: hypothetical protein K8S98_14210 [Planctomycetes bacterium]|nr:hypothetical protein [Planctomycetota bacterium]